MIFEDLDAWKNARRLTNGIYRICQENPLRSDFGLRDQLQRAAVSTMSNVAEGFERVGRAEKLQLYNIARGSAGEVRSLLYVVLDNDLAVADTVINLQADSRQVSALIKGLTNSYAQNHPRPH